MKDFLLKMLDECYEAFAKWSVGDFDINDIF